MKKLFLFFSLMILWNGLLLSEEMEYKAKHGGIVKKTDNTFLEIVRNNDKTDIYITGHDHRNIVDKKLSLSAIAQVNGKSYPLELKLENDHYSTGPANSYLHKENNFVLMLTISFSGTVDRTTVHLGRNLYP